LLKDKKNHPDLRWAATLALGQIGDRSEAVLSELLRILDKEDKLKIAAADALGHLGEQDTRVIPRLIKALADADVAVQGNAAAALGRLRQQPQNCMPALVAALRRHRNYQGSNDPRHCILWAIPSFGPAAKGAVTGILEVAGGLGEDTDIRESAINALGRIGPAAKEAIPGLGAVQQELEDAGDSMLARHVAKALEAIRR